MQAKFGVGSIVVLLGVCGFLAMSKSPEAQAQRTAKTEVAAPRLEPTSWEYKVAILSYNPGERLSDEQRAARFEKLLNAEAKLGWEPVTSLLTRNTVQTIGGGVTTRDSTAFVAFRKPK